MKEKSMLEVYLPSISLKFIEGPITTTYVAVWVLVYAILIAILYRVMKFNKKNQEAVKEKTNEEMEALIQRQGGMRFSMFVGLMMILALCSRCWWFY